MAYPKSIDSWTNRINGTDVVWAADPNSLAAEIIAIEQALGTVPNVESKPPVGTPVTYSNVNARISDTMLRNQAPYVTMRSGGFYLNGQGPTQTQFVNHREQQYDPYGYFNGTDITTQASGLYMIDVMTIWNYYASGYCATTLNIRGLDVIYDCWRWDFPTTGPVALQWNLPYYERGGLTHISWMTPLKQGDRVRVKVENGTPKNPIGVHSSYLTMHYLRALPDFDYYYSGVE